MTTHAEEVAKQQQWKLRPEHASLRIFDNLVDNEFKPQEIQDAWQAKALTAIAQFASVQTPFYADVFAKRKLRPADIAGPADLPKLPVIGKPEVVAQQKAFHARSLPLGEALYGPTKSSGTTGTPVMVLHTEASNLMFSYLVQRNARWFGLQQGWTRMGVRPRYYVSVDAKGSPNPDGSVVRRETWAYLGYFYQTGLEYVINVSNTMEQQVAWLSEIRPEVALADPGVFEEWLLVTGGRKPVESLKVLIGAGSQLSMSLRAVLEERFAIPIHQVYGLNEIGIVATRCEAGRYHVHTEHCIVEITGEDGKPCAAGQTGRLLVTGLRNFAMPLLRYDTGDMATAVDGACPCGRTLPSFGEIAGRFRRYAGLPKGTRERFQAVRNALEKRSPDELSFLRRYQLHQSRENRFTLRLRIAAPIPDSFRAAMLQAWEPVAGDPPSPLTIVEVPEIPPGPGGKLLDFSSDLYTDAAAGPPAAR